MDKILIIGGPTATGKTKFALEIAQKIDGEIVSADSRQVYTGKNLIHGKDLPYNLKPRTSNLKWRDRYLKYYEIDGVRIWLYDVLNPGEEFNVSFWRKCADLVIAGIFKRNKLPIVVGGTGLYLKSLSQNLSQISVPPNKMLRQKFSEKSAKYLFNYLNKIDSYRAAQLNISDRHNPRRLIRSIEISLASPSLESREGLGVSYLQIGLTAPRGYLYQLVNQRVLDRIAAGAASEDSQLAGNPAKWQGIEHKIIRQQLTWFKKQPGIHWFNISRSGWKASATLQITSWYNNSGL